MTISATAIHLSSVCGRGSTFLGMARGKKIKSSELRVLMARRLRAARLAYEENGAQVARDLEVTPQVLNSYEKARSYPDELFIVKFCELTGCPADWILRGRMRAEMEPEMAVRIAHFDPDLVGSILPASGPAHERSVVEVGRESASKPSTNVRATKARVRVSS